MSDDRNINANLNVQPGEDSDEALLMLEEASAGLEAISDAAIEAGESLSDDFLDPLQTGLEQINNEIDIFRQGLVEAGAQSFPSLNDVPDDKGGGGGGDGGNGSGPSFGKATKSIQKLSASAQALGVEFDDTTNTVLGTATAIPPLIAGVQGLAASVTAAEIPFAPFIAAAAAMAALLGGAALITTVVYNKTVEETEEAVLRARDVTLVYNDALNLTTDAIDEQVSANEQLLETNLANQKATQDAIDALDEPNNVLFDLADGLGLVGGAGDELANDLKGLQEDAEGLRISTEGLTDAYGSAEVAANDAEQALLNNLDQIAETRKFEQDALSGSAEENRKRAESIANEKSTIQAQIKAIKDSGIETEKTAAELERLNGEMSNLNQQSNILSSSAVKAAESQKALAAAESELESAADSSARAVEAAGKRTSDAIQKEQKARQDAFAEEQKAEADNLKLLAEQSKEVSDLQKESHDDRIDAEEDFNKSIEDLVKNQSFLKAIDAQDEFSDTSKDRGKAAQQSLIDLQMQLAEERIVEEIAAMEALAEKEAAIAEASSLVSEAQQDEMRAQSSHNDDLLKLQQNQAAQQIQLQGQLGENMISMIQSIVGFSGEASAQVQRLLAQVNSGKGGKKARNDLTSLLNKVMS